MSTGSGPVAAYDSFSAGIAMVTVKSVSLHTLGAM